MLILALFALAVQDAEQFFASSCRQQEDMLDHAFGNGLSTAINTSYLNFLI